MSVKLGKKISEGACAEIFEWESKEKIIKLAKINTDHYAMRREYLNSKVVWDNCISIPQPFELIDVDGRPGIVFERIYGETLMELFFNQYLNPSDTEDNVRELNYEKTTRITARVLSEIHDKSIPDLPLQREALIYSINRVNYLTNFEKEMVVNILNSLPMKQQLCHGDPNPNNIFVRGKEALLIDWMDASIGNPEADLAEYIVMIRFAVLPPNTPKVIVEHFDSNREEIIKVFIDEYTKVSDITYEEIDSWIIPIAARKLSTDGIIEEEKKLLVEEIRKRLKKYK